MVEASGEVVDVFMVLGGVVVWCGGYFFKVFQGLFAVSISHSKVSIYAGSESNLCAILMSVLTVAIVMPLYSFKALAFMLSVTSDLVVIVVVVVWCGVSCH
jgi:hypothetical protein